MIKQIKLKNVASYDDILVQDLKQVNFVFGGNGSGKTTISKLLYNKYVKEVNSNLYMECGVDFASDKFNDYNILVYNDDFVKNHLKSKESIKGIYSVAQQDIETEEKIEKVKKDEDEIQNKIKGVEDKQNDIQKNIDTQKRDFENSCWQHLSTNKQKFDKCFSGFKNNKAAWASKCEEIFSIDKISNDTLDSVEAEYKTVFDTNSKHESIFENINFCLIEELEKEQIFGQAIVPQDSREMNKLIKQLNSSDWVKQGLNYLPKSGDQCPFCQQNITETIKKNIEYIFADEHYKQQKLQFEQARQDYKANIDSLKDMISDITQSNISFINLQNIKLLLSELETIVNSNKTNLDFKNKNLAKVITLQSSKEILVKIKCEIDNFNEQISKHNEVVNNERKKDDIINKVINIIANNLLYDTIKEHKQEIDKFNKQMNEENKRLEALELDLKDIESEIKDLQSKSSNIDDIMDKINKRLKEFGFIGFSFKKCDDGRNYQILRSDGKPVEKTLSEGEHRFVTFLYF
ncbi:MAG: AAA family ATPase, partial [Firmicutes bacterium]|nr:AAA family ATPase [Bacillota bacterium]